MAVFYLIFGLIVILGNITAVPSAVVLMFKCAFSPDAVAGGVLGTITSSMMSAMRYGVARGCFSNEAGMGSAAITAAAATTDDPVRQGYINMTGTFFDTIVICTITGLAICSSGVLGMTDASGELVVGSALTIEAFRTVLGTFGAWIVTIGIALFAFSTILGWNLFGKINVIYLFGRENAKRSTAVYTVIALVFIFAGTMMSNDLVWELTDLFNNLMVLPNALALFALTGTVAAIARNKTKAQL